MSSDERQSNAAYWRKRALIAELTRRLEEQPVQNHHQEIEALRTRLVAIEASRSWKLTAPLRTATEMIYGMRRRRKQSTDPVRREIAKDEIQQRIATLIQFADKEALADWKALLNSADSRKNIK